MPAGTSWPSYLGAAICAMVSMFAGAQTVHVFYKPLQNLNAKVEMEKQKLAEEVSVDLEESANITSKKSLDKEQLESEVKS